MSILKNTGTKIIGFKSRRLRPKLRNLSGMENIINLCFVCFVLVFDKKKLIGLSEIMILFICYGMCREGVGERGIELCH